MREIALYEVSAAIVAFLLAFFQYRYRTKRKPTQVWLLIILRSTVYFSLLLLLTNVSFVQSLYRIEKPHLVLAVDNSTSIAASENPEEVKNLLQALENNTRLNKHFQLQIYTFGSELRPGDSVSFTEPQTRIADALQTLRELYKNTVAPLLLVTDGNQTMGNDYEYEARRYPSPIFPLVLGDTTTHPDIAIRQVQVNRYTYLNQRFPVEVSLTYQGETPVTSRIVISSGKTVLHTQTLAFSKENNAATVQAEVVADKVGIKMIRVEATPLREEKNTVNNTQMAAVEVLDEKASIALVSAIRHPDISALQQCITSNKQWELRVMRPDEVTTGETHQLYILYQPDASFKTVFDQLARKPANSWILTGTHTDWAFLNNIQGAFSKAYSDITEEVLPEFSAAYRPFLTEDISFSTFPPLQTTVGEIRFLAPAEVLLYQRIGNVVTEEPLLATYEVDGSRGGVLFGEDLWRWRMEMYRSTGSFERADAFFGRLVQYLVSNRTKSRLQVFSEPFYYGGSDVIITAEFFDKNYIFNPDAELEITAKNKATGAATTYPLLLKNRIYQADLSALQAGDYAYTLTETRENIAQSGSFTIIPFDVEKQFTNADVKKLHRIANGSGGKLFTLPQSEQLINTLLAAERFIPIQKKEQKNLSLLNWKYWLFFIVAALSAEWFLRKYRGLI